MNPNHIKPLPGRPKDWYGVKLEVLNFESMMMEKLDLYDTEIPETQRQAAPRVTWGALASIVRHQFGRSFSNLIHP